MAPSSAVQSAQADLGALKLRQHAAWSSGDYAVVGTTLQIVGEELCEALDLRSGQKVLDVAAGNGNVTLAAARRWCDVVSTDYVPSLLERGRLRAAAEGLSVEFKEADAEALGFADASFDAVVSTFGVMFAPDQDKAAAELARVCKSGGKIGLANWTDVRSGGNFREVRVTQFRVPLPIARTFRGSLQDLLRADAQSLCRPRRGEPAGLKKRSACADRADEPGGRRYDGRSERVSRGRDHKTLIKHLLWQGSSRSRRSDDRSID